MALTVAATHTRERLARTTPGVSEKALGRLVTKEAA